jgi:hypothetical protein
MSILSASAIAYSILMEEFVRPFSISDKYERSIPTSAVHLAEQLVV